MKRLFQILVAIVFVLAGVFGAVPADAAKFYPARALTGGGEGALDAIDGALLATGDVAIIGTSDRDGYMYVLLATGDEESSPDVIAPDRNAGSKRWHLVQWGGNLDLARIQAALSNDFHNIGGADDDVPEPADLDGVFTANGMLMRSGPGSYGAATQGTHYYAPGGAPVAIGDGGTGASLSDPDANTLFGWDDSTGGFRYITIGANLSYDSATGTLSAIAGSGTGGSSAFADIITGTNTTAIMTIGTGATLSYSGTGIVNASRYRGVSSVDAVEFEALDGVTSAIQAQINSRASSSHTHAASEITSGIIDIVRLPTGTTSSSVALGNHNHGAVYAALSHNHSGADITSGIIGTAVLPLNAYNSAGIVASGSGQSNMVWKTDAAGNPAWRADATGSAPTFDTVLTGTNTSAVMTLGPGSMLTYSGLGIVNASRYQGVTTVDATEFGHLDGVTGNLQTQIDSKANTSHAHTAADITSGTLAVARGGTGSTDALSNGLVMVSDSGAIRESSVTTAALEALTDPAITFTHTGSSFAPVIVVDGTPEILWTFADGTTSTSATPSIDFGTAATRQTTLQVTPWSAVVRINVGYAADDGGDDSIELVTQQNVTAIDGLCLVAPTLQHICLSRNPITWLDLGNFRALTTVEAYAAGLEGINLQGCYSLDRLEVEQCDLTMLDVSECPQLGDLRASGNPNLMDIHFGNIGADLWHLCAGTNPSMFPTYPTGRFPILRDLYAQGSNQSGELKGIGTSWFSVRATDNNYTSADFTGCFRQSGGTLRLYNNDLTSLTLAGCTGLTTIEAQNNDLSPEAVTAVLRDLDENGAGNGTVNLTGNSAPSAGGAAYIASLEGKGWSVYVDEGMITLSSIAVTPAGPSINAGASQQFTATGTYSDASTENLTSSVTWSSSQTGTATITSGGLATAIAAGSTTITATLGAISGNTTLTVVELGVTDITVTPANQTIYDGHTQQYTATATYEDGSTGNITSTVTWSSTSTDVATIASGGLATGEGPGSTYIVATSGSVHNSTGLTVAAVELSSIAVTPADAEIAVGDTQQYTATGTYNDSSTGNLTSGVTWGTGNSLICTIDTTGLATGVDEGTTSISATLGSIVGTTGVEVVPEQQAMITFVTVNDSMNVEVRVTGTPTVTWHWSDGTTSTGNTPTKTFATSERRTHYVTCEPDTALTQFRQVGYGDQGLRAVFGLSTFPNLNEVSIRYPVEEMSFANCHSITSLLLNGCYPTINTTEAVDQWFIDLDNAITGPVSGTLWMNSCGSRCTEASADARASLVSKGFTLNVD
jgi:hypothetical protein